MSRKKKIYEMVLFSLLTTIIIVMSFTPLGFIRIPALGLEITFLMIPVAVGAILLGPLYGALLGFIFGFTSLLQCVFGTSAFGATLLTINPIYTIIVCVVSRTLMGYLTGLIYKLLEKKLKDSVVSHIITCASSAILNTLFFMSLLCLCFYNTEYLQSIGTGLGTSNVFAFVIAFVGINGLVEAGVNIVIGAAVSKVIAVNFKKKYK